MDKSDSDTGDKQNISAILYINTIKNKCIETHLTVHTHLLKMEYLQLFSFISVSGKFSTEDCGSAAIYEMREVV